MEQSKTNMDGVTVDLIFAPQEDKSIRRAIAGMLLAAAMERLQEKQDIGKEPVA